MMASSLSSSRASSYVYMLVIVQAAWSYTVDKQLGLFSNPLPTLKFSHASGAGSQTIGPSQVVAYSPTSLYYRICY